MDTRQQAPQQTRAVHQGPLEIMKAASRGAMQLIWVNGELEAREKVRQPIVLAVP